MRDRERPSGRLLRLGGMDASYVDLADARHLEFDYLRWLRALVRAAGARRVVHVGGAGCALARALAAERPAHRQEVIERDAGRRRGGARAPRAAARARAWGCGSATGGRCSPRGRTARPTRS